MRRDKSTKIVRIPGAGHECWHLVQEAKSRDDALRDRRSRIHDQDQIMNEVIKVPNRPNIVSEKVDAAGLEREGEDD